MTGYKTTEEEILQMGAMIWNTDFWLSLTENGKTLNPLKREKNQQDQKRRKKVSKNV